MKKAVISAIILFTASCTSTQKGGSFVQRTVPAGSSIGVIVDGSNPMKNMITMRFMAKGYNVKAINANDIYTMKDYFNISDFKYLAYNEQLPVVGENGDQPITSAQKSFDSIFKLHVYNYELNKAETLRSIRDRWDVRYLIILEMADWEKYSWGRAIDLSTMDIIWVQNHPTSYNDTAEAITDKFISVLSGR